MNVALFGGTFDPVHCGHLTAARAAMSSFRLDRIHFVTSGIPPHKRRLPLTPFAHRYAMVSLACEGASQFIPSLLESDEESGGQPNYSVVTARKMAANLSPEDRLWFIIGADAFLDVAQWREPAALLDTCDFIVISRPGFPIGEIRKAIPAEMRAGGTSGNTIELRQTRLHLLSSVESDISSSAIRILASQGESLAGLVPDSVAEYIRKQNLYRNDH